jgi:hypothetical protein
MVPPRPVTGDPLAAVDAAYRDAQYTVRKERGGRADLSSSREVSVLATFQTALDAMVHKLRVELMDAADPAAVAAAGVAAIDDLVRQYAGD